MRRKAHARGLGALAEQLKAKGKTVLGDLARAMGLRRVSSPSAAGAAGRSVTLAGGAPAADSGSKVARAAQPPRPIVRAAASPSAEATAGAHPPAPAAAVSQPRSPGTSQEPSPRGFLGALPQARQRITERAWPKEISEGEREAMRQQLERGIGTQFDGRRAGSATDVVIGLDFGTSASKVVRRAPYLPGERAYALPVPAHLNAESNPHLWQTLLWLHSDGVFSPWPEAGAVPVDGIKTALMGQDSHRILANSGMEAACTGLDAGVAYLAFAFRYARGWLLGAKGEAYNRMGLNWSVNVGLPAATYDSPMLTTYRRIAAAAWLISQRGCEICVASAREAFNDPRAAQAGRERDACIGLGVGIIPEVAAEVVGFARSTYREDGLYLMVDVGASTLDVCAFRLHTDRRGADRYAILTADVQPLGVLALRWYLAEGGQGEKFAREVGLVIRNVVWHTRLRRDPNASCWSERLPVFLCGGGRESRPHRAVAESLSPWLAQYTGGRGSRLDELECPQGLECLTPPEAFHRLAVAWGLSYPLFDIGTFDPPSKIPDIGPLPLKDFGHLFIGKDQV